MARFTIDIPDEEIQEEVKEILVKRISNQLWNSYGGGYVFRKDIKAEIRSLLKDHMDEVTERAVAAATSSIERKGLKKMIDRLEE